MEIEIGKFLEIGMFILIMFKCRFGFCIFCVL